MRRKERSWIRRRRRGRKEKRRRWLDISWVVSLPRDLRKVVARPIGPLLHPTPPSVQVYSAEVESGKQKSSELESFVQFSAVHHSSIETRTLSTEA